MKFALILCLSLLLDQIIGDPKSFPHPVIFIGKVIAFWKGKLFTDTNSFIRGLVLCIITLSTTGLFVWLTLYLTDCNIIVQIYLLYSALALRDLKDETASVVFHIMNNNLTQARKYLSYVVGRDTETLNAQEIITALIETISENSIDGVISVIFWAGLGQVIYDSYGMALGVWLFKAASTLDSMTGYEHYGRFGASGAKLDDIMNFIPARLGGLIIALSSGSREALNVFLRDRLNHKSPNSAHGESSFAGALGVRLGGGAYYRGKFEPRQYININARSSELYDVIRAWKLLNVSCTVFALMVIVFVII